MKAAHVASVMIALAGFGCAAHGNPAGGTGAEGSPARGVDDPATTQQVLPDDEEAILTVLRGVEAAFSDGDLTKWLSFLHSTYVIVAPEGVVAPASEEEALALLRPRMAALRARGYSRSEMKRATVKVLSPATALASVEWLRRNASGEELERLGGTYAFFKSRQGWKIVMVNVHPSSAVVELE